MSDLRTAAQQALEALEKSSPQGFYSCKCMGSQHWPHCYWKQHQDAITNLRAALAEPVLQTCNCRWDGEMQMQQCTLHEAHVDAIKEWAQRAKFAEKKLAALAEQRLTDMEQKMERSIESLRAALAEPVQEPVAWIQPDHLQKARRAPFLCRVEPTKRMVDFVPLYAAPPQRKPLTEEEIDNIWGSEKAFADIYAIARAVERAHGIV